MKDMKKSFFLIFLMGSLIMISSTVTGASATNGWVKSDILPYVRHTVSNPGSVKICGDHKCSPFENAKKPLQYMQKQSQAIHSINQNQVKFEKIYDKTSVKKQNQVQV